MNRRPSEVLRKNLDFIRSVALLHRTENLRVFGSILRGEDTEDSDLDLLVDPLPGATLLDLGAIQIELQEFLGIAVDILTPGDLPKKFREQVLSEAVPV
jgi:predicted nucleotidyltransferase